MENYENHVEISEDERAELLCALSYMQGVVFDLDLDEFYLEKLRQLQNTIINKKQIKWN